MKYLFIFFLLLCSPVFGDSFDNTEWGNKDSNLKFNGGNIIVGDSVGEYRVYDKGTLGEAYINAGGIVLKFKFRIVNGQLRLWMMSNNEKLNRKNGFPDTYYYDRVI